MIGRGAGSGSHPAIDRDQDHPAATMRHYRCAFRLSAMLMCSLAAIARAEVHVAGDPTAVRVTTSHDAISDVLSALAASFNVRYRTAIPLDATANAIYSGSLRRVVSRLLDGYNYVIRTDSAAIEIIVFGRRGEVAIPAPPPPSTQIEA